MSNNDQCENLPNVVSITINVINGTNIPRNVPRVEAVHIESDSNGSLHLICFILFTIFSNINIFKDPDIGLSDESINSTDMEISRRVPEVGTTISHSTACSNGNYFVELKQMLSLHVTFFSKGPSADESQNISFSTIRPFPRVEQNQETIRRTQRQTSRLGRTRILTDTPEKNAIEEEYNKKKEKENKKKSTKSKRCLIPEKGKQLSKKKKNEEKEVTVDVGSGGCFRLSNKKPKKGKNLRQNTKNKENDDEQCEEEDDESDGCYTFNDCVTRSGRSVHRPIRTNV
jgi:hypothetical protein